jgi:hypothetical protein
MEGSANMETNGRDLVESAHQKAAQRIDKSLPSAHSTVHYSALPEASNNSALFEEWNTYRREAGRLLAQGEGGHHILIKGDQIVGIFSTHDEAMKEGYRRFLGHPFLVHQIQEREPVVRQGHYFRTCRR